MTYDADLILEEQLDRLNELKLDFFRKTADIVMSLDTVALEDVRVDGSLTKESDILKLCSLLIENFDELTADDLSLLLRIADPCQLVKEAVCSIYINEVGSELVAENFDDLLALALTHKTMVDMNACQLLADSLDKKCSDY